MATAVVANAYGGPEVLSLVEVEVGAPGPGQVKLAVRAAGVNPYDYKLYGGASGADPARLPLRIGLEASGVLTEVGEGALGPDARPWQVGDEVIAHPVPGAYATELLAPAGNLVLKPGLLTWEQAGGLLLVGVTAAHAIAAAGVVPGETVLVHGASGAVGLMAVQQAVADGARVIGTASPGNHALLGSLGAEPVSYGPGLEERVRALSPGGVDAAIDIVGNDEALDVSLALVPQRSRIVEVVASPRAAQLGVKLIGAGPGADPGTAVRAAARPRLAQLAAEGRIRSLVAATFPLAEVAQAHEQQRRGRGGGKIILLP
jgi:NADPH:quinone reductase-like Zn-dependent oxidoreductase